jgi:tetratricopeptide (TPR) repeat protein
VRPAAVLIVLAATLAYSNSFQGVLVFDDLPSITDNLTIRDLWSPDIFSAIHQDAATVQGRPMANASLAVSYALDRDLQFMGCPLLGYHVVNLLIHILAGLTLFGIVRRTLTLERFGEPRPAGSGPSGEPRTEVSGHVLPRTEVSGHVLPRTEVSGHALPRPGGSGLGRASTPLALAVAILWTLHPLQTESVTYIVQRTEALMGLFYLLTLYCVIRAATAGSARRPPITERAWHPSKARRLWIVAAVLACAAGMASKEVMVSAPLVVLLYDRLFLTGSWRETFRRRWGCHLALSGTLAIVFFLAFGSGSRGSTAGFGVTGLLSPLQYALNETNVIARYLRLALAPVGLCLDYYWQPAGSTFDLLPGLLLVGILLAAWAWAIFRGSAWAFLGAWFFLILAPTSSLMPIKDLAFEHRMYLPLAAVIAAVTIGPYLLARSRTRRWALGMLAMAAAVMLGALTYQRNADYRSALAIWKDALVTNPDNPRAHLGCALELSKDPRGFKEAQEHYLKALAADPNGQNEADQIKGYSNRGLMYLHEGKYGLAAEDLEKAVKLGPSLWLAWGNLAYAHMELGQYSKAIRDATRAIELKPHGQFTPGIYDTRGQTYCRMGDYAHAIADLTTAITTSKKPVPEFYNNRARAYFKSNQLGKAWADADQCIRLGGKLDPDVQQAIGTQTRP